jgi:hypothetical protein
VCLRFKDETGTALPLADRQGALGPVAAFTLNRASGPGVDGAAGRGCLDRAPRRFIAIAQVAARRPRAWWALIASPDAAWTARAVAAAAAPCITG